MVVFGHENSNTVEFVDSGSVVSSAPVFFADPVPPPGEALLDGPEGRHAARVRRLRAGEELILTDGLGRHAEATVMGAERSGLRLQVGQPQLAPRPSPRFVAVQALAKGDRGERAVELLTELGVDEVIPWAAQRCVAKWGDPGGDKAHKARERWFSVAREAAKQSRRMYFPTIAGVASTADVARRCQGSAAALVLHSSAEHRLADCSFPGGGEVAVVIGPEGGITDAELAAFTAAGVAVVRLGDDVLRTSTAGAAALAAISMYTRWRG